MCGIVGLISVGHEDEPSLRAMATSMAAAIAHRGPDGQGTWADPAHGVALGHRRLAIVDLSPHGSQPMQSACSRYMLVFNGEIYNHLTLRAALGNVPWRGHSDTETMLACFTRHGVEATLPKLVGMFAFAVWDRKTQTLTLARDRMGEKPLYFGRLQGGDLVFASELKALRAHPRWQCTIDRDALALFLRYNAVPGPFSIYRGISKLEPGCFAQVSRHGEVRLQSYWDTVSVARAAQADRLALDDASATDALEGLLMQSLNGQMMADVPLGAFLSGGVDSSTVVALMALSSSQPVRTFSIGFDDKDFDEAGYAKAVAAHLGTQHTELCMTARDTLDVVPLLPTIYDEPFADASQIPTYLVAKMARQHVTVALSGDAGDELFAGYNRYLIADRLWHRLERVPLLLRQGVARLILDARPSSLDALARAGGLVLPPLRRHRQIGDKLHKLAANVIGAASDAAMYRNLVSHWQDPASLVLGATEPRTALDRTDLPSARETSVIERMSLLDQITYLPDDILVKVDRAAMAVSLETRVPMLDHRVVEFAFRLPMHQKVRDGQTKWLLRQVLYRHVPRALIERPKRGFEVPIASWLRGPLRGWAQELLAPARLRGEGLLNAESVNARWIEHQQGTRNWHNALWGVLMFQAWLESIRGPAAQLPVRGECLAIAGGPA
jgi:asparagine synthase (glutamine-hydrolysing)